MIFVISTLLFSALVLISIIVKIAPDQNIRKEENAVCLINIL